jgi:hypothetical protein
MGRGSAPLLAGESRSERREYTIALLKTLRDLTRAGKIRRVRKKWLVPFVQNSQATNMAKILGLPNPAV